MKVSPLSSRVISSIFPFLLLCTKNTNSNWVLIYQIENHYNDKKTFALFCDEDMDLTTSWDESVQGSVC